MAHLTHVVNTVLEKNLNIVTMTLNSISKTFPQKCTMMPKITFSMLGVKNVLEKNNTVGKV